MARILWSREALRNLDSIAEYLYEYAPTYAAALLVALVDATEALERFPRSGRIVPEFDSDDLREVIFERYRIVYSIDGNTVTIYSVPHSSMDLVSRLRDQGERS